VEQPNDRHIDQLMAQKILGHTLFYEKNGAMRERLPNGQTRPLRPYVSDINAAWEVVTKLGVTLLPTTEGWFALIGDKPQWRSPAEFMTYLGKADFVHAGAAVAPQASHAVCLAAARWLENRETRAASTETGTAAETHAPQGVADAGERPDLHS
jgi:hypothetical protein